MASLNAKKVAQDVIETVGKEELAKQIRQRLDTLSKIKLEKPDIRSSVYLVKCHRFYKIGRTHRLNDRITCMQVGNPYELQLIKSAKTDDAEKLEQELQERYQDKHIRGEWFELDKRDVGEIAQILENCE